MAHRFLARFLSDLDLVFWILESPADFRHCYRYGGLSRAEWERISSDAKQRRLVREMKQKKWLEEREKGDRVILQINQDALVSYFKEQIKNTNQKLPAGECCLVTFDFPTGANDARASWRHFLKQVGFARAQLSVFVCQKDVILPVKALSRLLGIEKWVRVFHAKESTLVSKKTSGKGEKKWKRKNR